MVRVRVTNAQRSVPVFLARMRTVAQCAARRLGIRASGDLVITFIDARRMRALNKRFMHHDWATDVLSFRYPGEPVIGEILIAPRQAQAYARRHGISYAVELARYVVHGLLHWLGYDDRTPQEQQAMRALENKLLSDCRVAVKGVGYRV